MARLVIPTTPNDGEALLVSAALQIRGNVCDIWYTSDYPQAMGHTIKFQGATEIQLNSRFNGPDSWAYDTCWLRDLYPPTVDTALVHPEDRDFLIRTHRQYYYGHWNLLADRQVKGSPHFWVNSLEAARRAESKPLQLHLARAAGFRVPETIISNDPDEIRLFVASSPTGCVRKSLVPHEWYEGTQCISNKTTRVSASNLPKDSVLALHAEIYQREVQKESEIRAVFFGDTSFALRMRPLPSVSCQTVDWRILHHRSIASHDIFQLPEQLHQQCRNLMRRLGIVSASFDFMVDHNHDLYFAELNQGGLFLWMEGSGLPVLPAFIDFLLAQDPDFKWSSSDSSCLAASDVRASATFKELCDLEISHLIPPRQVAFGT